MGKTYSVTLVTMENPTGQTPGGRDRARAALAETLATEAVYLTCTVIMMAAWYWRDDLLTAGKRLLRSARGGPPGPRPGGVAMVMADFRAELCEIDHAPQQPAGRGTVA